ncbi:MAG: hypothetical protein J6X34_02380 [Clostridia bacterium]|nr:hypothetical protein [Clostridia bacterium]
MSMRRKAELADAHGSDTVTSVKNRGKSVHPHPVLRAGPKKAKKHANADMAELADAHGSGPCESSLIQVGVLLSALKNSLEINVPGLFSFSVASPSQSRSAENNIGARA